ncbi:hypothetical protein O997_06530 [Anaplasma phagocytophilum str. MRK]|nr:hypothetical protein O997_06530 [Anaplasma phagocytophilum str. MRK]
MVFSSGVSFVRSLATFCALSFVSGFGDAVTPDFSVEVGQFFPSFRVFSAKSFRVSSVVL